MTDLSQFSEGWASVEPNSFEDIGAGLFQVRFKKIELKTAKTTGNPMFAFQFGVISGDKRGKTCFMNMVLTEGSRGIVKGNFEAIGFTGDPQQFWQQSQHFLNQAIEIERTPNGTDQQGRPQYNTYWKKRLDIPITDGVDFRPPPETANPF